MEAARRIRQVVRSHDTVARMGGDEFVVHLGGLTESADARLVAEVVRAELDATVRLPGHGTEVLVEVTASVGVAVASGVDADELLRPRRRRDVRRQAAPAATGSSRPTDLDPQRDPRIVPTTTVRSWVLGEAWWAEIARSRRWPPSSTRRSPAGWS